jgi:hypothetical protein
MNTPTKKSLAYATRDEVEVQLNLLDGKLPDDLYGYVFFNSPCGTVNSGGLPYKEKLADGKSNPEFGSSVFNGDAMMLRFDLSQKGLIRYKSKMLKTPCWYADDATKMGNTEYPSNIGFKMIGIGRTSFKFGARNELNTAINPFKFNDDAHVRMSANFDMGRPWEFDTETMELKTVIGSTKEWVGEIPPSIDYPFPMYQSSAHPIFDPVTKEFYTVSFTRDFETMVFYRKFGKRMLTHHDEIETKLHNHVSAIHAEASAQGTLDKDHSRKINTFYKNIDKHLNRGESLLDKIKKPLHWLFGKIMEFIVWMADLLTGMKNRVYLLRWDGSQVHRWTVVDAETGKPIGVNQCMHQNNLSRDYIVLSDSAFKFSADIMMSNPFPHNQKLDEKLRDLTAITQEPFTPIFIIKKSDLKDTSKTVKAKKIIIDLETVHFSMDYENPNNIITMHTAHNAASCAAEWVRSYDTLSIYDNLPPEKSRSKPNTVGLMTCGEMDIGRIGKFVIDAEKAIILEQPKIHLTGKEQENGAHTWAIALHTYRDIISATETVDKIRHIYWQSYGTDPRYLTKFIEDLYRDYPHRIIPVKEMIEMNKKWIPFCLSRQNTESMTLDDCFVFEINQNLRSMQFIPRKGSNGHIEPQMDGYIFCTMIVGPDNMEIDEYSREIWIFDAADLKAGPVCKLSHPEMNYAFTIHSAWIEECVSQETTYKVNVEEDLQYMINKMKDKDKKFFTEFMSKNVYPHFDK